ncbi:MAG: cytochrome b N-terminal domain-containing protein [Betaproteobacteria bacterium]|nr:cytochrome b N-terminal domain-containing protein [Betaproteobacteria bacterium]
MAGVPDLAEWIRERIRLKKARPIPAHVNFFYCFGGISLFLILLQLVSGLFMLFFYVPQPDQALQSIVVLSNEVPLGWLFRNLHRWSSTLLLATVFSHMLIVFYLKAYQSPRQFTWLTGVFQLLLVFLLVATGLILPWDWRSYWSYAMWLDYVNTWVGGAQIQQWLLDHFTLKLIYYVHILAIPIGLAVFLYFHFRMVKKYGISEPL